VTKLINAQQS